MRDSKNETPKLRIRPWRQRLRLHSGQPTSTLNIIHESRKKSIPKQDTETDPDFVPPSPALACFSCHMSTFHDDPEPGRTAVRASAKSTGFWRAFRGGSIGFGNQLAGVGVNAIVFHPLPVFLVQLWPFRAEFEASIPGLDVVKSFGARGYARRSIDMRASAGRVPPSRSRCQYSSFRFRCTDTARRHFLARHKGE